MSKQKVIYISGPMTGIPLFNFPQFLKAIHPAAEDFRERTGHFPRVVCPAMVDLDAGLNPYLPLEDQGTTYDEVLSRDLRTIREGIDCIYMLEGWQESQGARRELQNALMVGADVRFLEEGDLALWAHD